MAHSCVPQNQALAVCRGFVPGIQVCGTHRREDLLNAAITSNAKEEELVNHYIAPSSSSKAEFIYNNLRIMKGLALWVGYRIDLPCHARGKR